MILIQIAFFVALVLAFDLFFPIIKSRISLAIKKRRLRRATRKYKEEVRKNMTA
jgi:hypothetical protein